MSGNRIDYILLSPDLATGIIALGILPLNNHLISDYRASYYDIYVQALFDIKEIEKLTHGTRRKLQLSKPSVVKKYLDKLEQLYVDHKILQRIQALVLQFENKTTSEYTRLIIEFNKLDDEKIDTQEQLRTTVISPHRKVHMLGPQN